ncbi:MAG: helix-turn-helix domain-containing protein [Pseudomonadota bacterium]
MATKISLDELSVVQIARKLKVSDGAIYYYFRTRDDLVRALFARTAAQFDYEPLEGDWQEVLSRYSLNLFDALVKRPGRARYFLSAGISDLEQMRVFVRVINAVMASGLSLEPALGVYRLYIMTAIRAAHSHDEYHAYWDHLPVEDVNERLELLHKAVELEGVDFLPVTSDPDYLNERALLIRTLAVLGKGLGPDAVGFEAMPQSS